jgi:hypothetical protein
MQLWVQWFTFFFTVNYVALGWFAAEISKNQVFNRRPLYYVAALFVSQNALGIVICIIASRWFMNTGRALETRYQGLGVKPPQFAHRYYGVAIVVGAIAMAIVAVCWLLFAVRP